jgi:peptidyl-prolyl cis-trans isomerase SurA
VVDEIVARVNGTNITKSFLKKPQALMGGGLLSLEDAVTSELLFQKAKERQLLSTSAEVDRQITSLKISNGISHLTDEEFEEELKQEGLSLAEYKSQMAKLIAIERLKSAEFSERVVVTSQEIENYYKENPSWSAEKYCINICELTFDNVDEDGNLKEDVETKDLSWDDLGWINKKDLSSNLSFVSEMEKNQISKPIKVGDSYQLVKVVDRSERLLRSLDDRYNEIESQLQSEKRVKFEQEFEKELRADASIVYLT